MTRNSKVVRAVLLAAVALMAASLVACASQQPSSSASSASASSVVSSSSVSGSSVSPSGPSAAITGAEDVVTIGLDYSAGTGFEWKCTQDPEGVVSLVSQTTEDRAKDEAVAGGPLREQYTFRAAKPGEVTLTFELVRSWESGSAETQVYAFTVSSDLKMVLNPYKSHFTNEPEWGSNS